MTEIHIHYDKKPRKMVHTGIEYFNGGYSWDFLTGCLHHQTGVCGGGGKDFHCWAKSLAEGRLKRFMPFGFEPTIYPSRFLDPLQIKKPSRIAVCFKGDLFGNWIDPEYRGYTWGGVNNLTLPEVVFAIAREARQHTFLFLTKNPAGYLKWGQFPDNCWCGVTTTGFDCNSSLEDALGNVKAKNKFVSIEPLLDYSPMDYRWVNWVIVGGFSGGKRQPRIEYIREIVEATDKAGISVWLKDNLKPLLNETVKFSDKWVWAKDIGHGGLYRQEIPEA